MPLLLTQQISDGGVLPHAGIWHSFLGGTVTPQTRFWGLVQVQRCGMLQRSGNGHGSICTLPTSLNNPGDHGLSSGGLSPAIPGDVEQFLCPGDSCWRAAQPAWWGSGLAEDPPDPQIFGFAKSLRQAGSGSGCRRSKVVPCVCVCVHIYKYKYREKRYCRGFLLLLLLLFGTCWGWGAG